MNIEMGDEVEDLISGFKGIVVARTEFFNGCIQFNVCPKWDGKTSNIEELSIDERTLKIIKKGKVKRPQKADESDETTGGKTRAGFKQRGY